MTELEKQHREKLLKILEEHQLGDIKNYRKEVNLRNGKLSVGVHHAGSYGIHYYDGFPALQVMFYRGHEFLSQLQRHSYDYDIDELVRIIIKKLHPKETK